MEGLADILVKVLPWLQGVVGYADILVKATPSFGAGGLSFLFYVTTPLVVFGMFFFMVQTKKRMNGNGQ